MKMGLWRCLKTSVDHKVHDGFLEFFAASAAEAAAAAAATTCTAAATAVVVVVFETYVMFAPVKHDLLLHMS